MAEYSGMNKWDIGATDLVIVGDSRLAIHQSLAVTTCKKESLMTQLNPHECDTMRVNAFRVGTVTRAIRAYVEEPDQREWDDQDEKLIAWLGPQNTVRAMLGKTHTGFDQTTAYEWRRNTQYQYEYAQARDKVL
ncbi:hypothetical protein PHMEG_0005908 [Phytophthora megakarya]|uniref:Reverse transcriptase n=1 Tax=Phytophthora megakarya TaxID=4795 RepID=A0A225WQ56_9STRA|nr:hypothetical protein PHMEG_0005908 [Phytophthora megakarya]